LNRLLEDEAFYQQLKSAQTAMGEYPVRFDGRATERVVGLMKKGVAAIRQRATDGKIRRH
ncbi:MAG: hypothetical protein P8101_22620, partial [Candidatus Thiodiazotropha sp.]